jgi:DNA topoisomerase-1
MAEWDEAAHPRGQGGKFDAAGAVASWAAKRAEAGEEKAVRVIPRARVEGNGYAGVKKDLIHEVHEFSGKTGLAAVIHRTDGIKVYKYTEKHEQQQADKKFARAARMDKVMDKLRATIKEDMHSKDEKTRALATVASIIDQHAIRIGGSAAEERTGSVGASTLRAEHVQKDSDGTHLRYSGKSGVDADKVLKDKALERSVKEHAAGKAPGERLFNVRPQEVNAYLAKAAGAKITAKDFRTFTASRLAHEAISKLPAPKSMKEAKDNVKAVIEKVAAHLDHTPAVCRAKYINPRVIDSYMARVAHSTSRKAA